MTGSLSGLVRDPSGAAVAGATLTLENVALKTRYKAVSDGQGFYSFPTIPVGRYDLTIEATGFKTEKKRNLIVDTDAALTVDASLEVGAESETVTVSATEATTEAQVDTVATHLGELVTGSQMTALPLNGRSYTDLLSIQPGVIPVTTLQPNSVIMAGVTGAISPSGDLNAGNESIDGQRESSNGFTVDGVDVQEHMNGGTSIIPDLDSIDEFRVLTNNFDPEYGNYNGGMINVVTKSGTNSFHGNAFEFLRNTVLDARGYFDPIRPEFQQNQFGGTFGGPVQRQKIYFFSDYQGTRTSQGIPSGVLTVPSVQDRIGNLSDLGANAFTTTTLVTDQSTCKNLGLSAPCEVSSPSTVAAGGNLAQILSTALKYPVSSGEPYYAAGCTSSAQCVFPNEVIPQSAWSAPAQHLLQYIPAPNVSADQFSTAAFAQTVRDDKDSGRVDLNADRWGQISTYYFFDDYRLDDPYPGAQGGASIPGFDALTFGRAQLLSLGETKLFGTNTVNEFRLGLLRNANAIGQPKGGLGVTLASQGFVTGAGTQGIAIQAPQFEGVMNIVFPTFVMGVPITNETQDNNTLYLGDTISKVTGSHTIKFGGQFHLDQVNEHPNATFNGTFNINGSETGNAFADFLIGVPSNFTQSSGAPFYLRNRYEGLFAQDSWRARSNLTMNFGLRGDFIMPWWEKYNQLQTIIPGRQSILYPNAPEDLVVPGDPGIPSTISPSKVFNLAPRIGIAYSPGFDHGILSSLFGKKDESSIRASYGIFYTEFPGLTAGIMYAVPPFGYNYLSPVEPLFATPFTNAGDGDQNINPFPLTFPPHDVSGKHPYNDFNFTNVIPISADPYWYYRNVVPYTEDFMLSLQRQIRPSLLWTASYVGNQGHHLIAVVSTNPGNPALCLSLSQTTEVAPGTETCGPFGEDGTYVTPSGEVIEGTRVGLGSNYGENTAQRTIANSSYNGLETNLRYVGKRSNFLFGYTYSKSIDQASNLGEQLDPLDLRFTRAISTFDMRHNFVASYRYMPPFDRLFNVSRLTQGWAISGTTRFATGFPVTLFDDSDNSLLGTLGNGVNNYLLDTPQFDGAPLDINTNPRAGRPEFNIAAFSPEALGQLGNAKRRFFHGPGIDNFDFTLEKSLPISEGKTCEFRLEGFNVFNHAQFYASSTGLAAVDAEVNDPNFGRIVNVADPRLVQLAAKFTF
ncbi:MAG TPA: carboxypeptidase regulatory-like domain-containing protein [Candidatus Cybelea sp.]|nr:carboxypeptidase regulatory-like domain-containing protein [Candidatus Cybelea sp.]